MTPIKSMVVVLAKNAAKLRATVVFLERRGIAARIVPTLNEAVKLFANKEANMLLLSVNFPHPKVEMLPVLMYQSFQIETILCAEETDRKSSGRLNGAKTKHVLFGPITGPVVMMKVRQIEREKSEVESDLSMELSQKKNSGYRMGDEKSESEKKTALADLIKSLSEPVNQTSSQENELQKSGTTIVQKGQRSKFMSEIEERAAELESGSISERAQRLRQGIDLGLNAVLKKTGTAFRFMRPSDFRSKTAGRQQSLNGEPLNQGGENVQEQSKALGDALELSAESAKAPLTEAEIIQACLNEALAIVAGAPNSSVLELSAYKTAALVSLRTLKVSCSFIISLAYARKTASEIFDRIETAFFYLLRDYGIEFENEQTHSILLDNMSVVARAFQSSDYVRITQTPEVQIGVASVVSKNPVAAVEHYAENMLSVSVGDIPVDEPVTFSVFLHLKRNDKYIRYLKEGASLTRPQASRLTKHHPNVLLDSKEVDAYRRHFAAHAILAPKRTAS